MEKLSLDEINHELKSLELKEKLLTFDRNIEMRYEEKLANQRLSILQELRYLLTATKIDESKSIVEIALTIVSFFLLKTLTSPK
jgi:hypothetical protein